MGVFVIAEAGSSHDSNTNKMCDLVNVAKRAGADAVKFQWTSSPQRLADRRHAHDYIGAYRTIAFQGPTLFWLKTICDAAGIEFMCTVYLPEDIPVVAPLVERFKVASFECQDLAFIQAHYKYFPRPIIVSIPGMGLELAKVFCGVYEIPDVPVPIIDFLHCVSAYPAPTSQMNLRAIRAHRFSGLSDHSGHPFMGALAVAAGAQIIEVHFRLDSTDPANPDYGHSLSPGQLVQYVQNVRFAEAALGDGEKRLMPSEERWAKYRVELTKNER